MTFKVLALDGGGAWCLIQAKVLMDLYGADTPGQEILKQFDIVAGCSGGACVTAALIENRTPAQVLDLFKNEASRTEVFNPLSWYEKLQWVRLFADIGPQFSTQRKGEGLRRLFPNAANRKLKDLDFPAPNGGRVSFLFMTYDFDRDRGRFVRSDADSLATNFPRAPEEMFVTDAAHASSTAPVNYFDAPALINGKRYWDGGVAGYNNPALAGAMEVLVRRPEISKASIRVLSLGTGSAFLPLRVPGKPWLEKQPSGTEIEDTVKKVSLAILTDPPDAHTYITHVVLGGNLPGASRELPFQQSPIVRFNPLIQPVVRNGEWDDVPGLLREEFQRLVALDLAAVADLDVALIEKFADAWMRGLVPNELVVSNQPIRSGPLPEQPPTELCEVGWRTYKEASDAWKAIMRT